MKTNKKTRSFKFKITIYITSFVVFVLLMLWSSVSLLSEYLFEQYQLRIVEDVASSIDNTMSDEELEEIAYKNNVCILSTSESKILNNYNTQMIGCGLHEIDSNVSDMIKEFISSSELNYRYRFVNNLNKTSAVLFATQISDTNYFIYANLEDTSVFTTLIEDQLLRVTIIAIIVSILISFYISNKIADPIVKITNKAKYLGSDNTLKFESSGIKEVDELTDALIKSNDEISKTSKFKKDLLANVSHDLKTPLTMIKAYAELVRDYSCTDKAKQEERLNIIINETDRLTVLVNDILDMSKLQSNSNKLHLEKYDLIEQINNIINNYQIIKETEHYNFTLNIPKKLIINADKSKLNQVIYNLINNAINYTGDDKKVFINVKKRNLGGYLLEIVDTGKGIDKEEINNIWDKYYKTDKNHKRNVVSTGIGLSIVKEILLLHNYDYGVNSSKKGTSFWFIIK